MQQQLSHSMITSFRFRQNCSLSTPLFLRGGLPEFSEPRSTSLDFWLAPSLWRYSVPPLLVQAIVARYFNAKFFVSDPPPILRSSYFSEASARPPRVPTQPIPIHHCSIRTHLNTFFSHIFSYTPWTNSSSHPLTDVGDEWTNGTVLIARAHETRSKLFHFYPPLAATASSANCCAFAPLFLSLSLSLSPSLPLSNHSCRDAPLAPLRSAKYLGSFIAPSSSSIPDVNFMCSQAASAFKSFDFCFCHPLMSCLPLSCWLNIPSWPRISNLLHSSNL